MDEAFLKVEASYKIGGDMGNFISIGDRVCLYCEDTQSFVYNHYNSATKNGLYIYPKQDHINPDIPTLHAIIFEISIQNRYKLNRKYRKWLEVSHSDDRDMTSPEMISARAPSLAENKDNEAEQKRQNGKKLTYGDIIQLRHVFTGDYVHMSTTSTSQQDKNNLVTSLLPYNAKNAQFKILPRYKVKSEGETVQSNDQIVFESIKSPGHYFHASSSYQIDNLTEAYEVNVGVDKSGFTIIGCWREKEEQKNSVRGGSCIRLFHKELEAYLTAEGLFEESVTENVHFRVRALDPHRPKTLTPSTSGLTYWQIEFEHSVIDGDIIRWEDQVRLRHMVTRKYLFVNNKKNVSLTDNCHDPRTVFRIHPLIMESDNINFGNYCRIEHMLTHYWLHALNEDYVRHNVESGSDTSMTATIWDDTPSMQVAASNMRLYADAYTIQKVEDKDVQNFNYVAGLVPFLFDVIDERNMQINLNSERTHGILMALKNMKEFLIPNGKPNKDRQKLFRNLRVIDLFVKMLKFPLIDSPDHYMTHVNKAAYDVMYTYLLGKSRKNALYFAKYIQFFETQFREKGGIGLNVATIIIELIRDKRKIVDRIGKTLIDRFITLLAETRNYRFLDLLNVLCVCDGVSLPNNQTYITENCLWIHKASLFQFDRGQNVNKKPNVIYISVDDGQSWESLYDFIDPSALGFSEDQYQFLTKQLDLFKALCHGRNDFAIHTITKELRFLTWEDAFLCISRDDLPLTLRAKFCEAVITIFIDVGNNYSVLDFPNIVFSYNYIATKDMDKGEGKNAVYQLSSIFPTLRDWIEKFLQMHNTIVASQVGLNVMIEQVLCVLKHLVKFGYYNRQDLNSLLSPLMSILDGRNDMPFPIEAGRSLAKEVQQTLQTYRQTTRYRPSIEADAVANVKYEAMAVLKHLITYQRNERLGAFLVKFKEAEQHRDPSNKRYKKRFANVLKPLLSEQYDVSDQNKTTMRHHKHVHDEIKKMFHETEFFNLDEATEILLDLAKYQNDKIITRSLDILVKLYTSESNMFQLASHSQLLLTNDSIKVHHEIQETLPIMRRLANAKMNESQRETMNANLLSLIEYLHLPKSPGEPHMMNQNVMISHGVLDILLTIVFQEFDIRLPDQYEGMVCIMKNALHVMKMLTCGNTHVQERLIGQIDNLLEIRGVEADLAITLKEVVSQSLCKAYILFIS